MNVCLFVCLYICLFFCFNHLGRHTESLSENFVRIWLDLAEILRIRKLDWKMFIFLFVCLYICLFFALIIVEYQQEVSLKFCEDRTWFGWDIKVYKIRPENVYLFVCLFVCLFIRYFFALIIVEYPKEVSLKISWRSDLIWLRY